MAVASETYAPFKINGKKNYRMKHLETIPFFIVAELNISHVSIKV